MADNNYVHTFDYNGQRHTVVGPKDATDAELIASVADAPPADAATAAPPATASDRTQAASSGLYSGAANLLGMPMDAAANVTDLGKAALGYGISKATGKAPPSALEVDSDRTALPGSGDWFKKLMNSAGIDTQTRRQDDTASRYLHAAGETIPGVLTDTPGMSGVGTIGKTVANAAGGVAGQAAADSGLGPAGTMAAGMLTQSGLRGGAAATSAATKGFLRGGATPEQVQDNIDSFHAAGAEPSVSQATQGRAATAIEKYLAKVPGGAGPMAAAGMGLQKDLGEDLTGNAALLSPKASTVLAGRAIENDVTQDGTGFADRFRATGKKLFDKVDELVPPQHPVPITRAMAALDKLTAAIPNAEATSDWAAKNPAQADLLELKAALGEDTSPKVPAAQTVTIGGQKMYLIPGPNGGSRMSPTPPPGVGGSTGVLPYQAVAAIRTKLGQMIKNDQLVGDKANAGLKEVFGALSDDVSDAAGKVSPSAQNAVTRAKNYWKAGQDRLDTLYDTINNTTTGPQDIFHNAMAGTDEGDHALHAVMQAATPATRRMITSTVLQRLGRARSGAQDDVGGQFSTETFLTNWDKLSAAAKQELFNRNDKMPDDYTVNLDRLASVAANLRKGNQVFKNPSETASSNALITTGDMLKTAGATAGGALAAHKPGLALGTALSVAVGLGGNNFAARLLTDPKTAAWLANRTRLDGKSMILSGYQLSKIATEQNDPQLKALAQGIMEKDRGGPLPIGPITQGGDGNP